MNELALPMTFIRFILIKWILYICNGTKMNCCGLIEERFLRNKICPLWQRSVTSGPENWKLALKNSWVASGKWTVFVYDIFIFPAPSYFLCLVGSTGFNNKNNSNKSWLKGIILLKAEAILQTQSIAGIYNYCMRIFCSYSCLDVDSFNITIPILWQAHHSTLISYTV